MPLYIPTCNLFHSKNTGLCQRVKRMEPTLEEIIMRVEPMNVTTSTPDSTWAPFQISEANLKIRVCYYETLGKQLGSNMNV